MNDLVKRQEVFDIINQFDNDEQQKPLINQIRACLYGLESQTLFNGKWLWVFNRPIYKNKSLWGEDSYVTGWECSECGYGAGLYVHAGKYDDSMESALIGLNDERTPYCPHCGTKMEGLYNELDSAL